MVLLVFLFNEKIYHYERVNWCLLQ